MIGFTRGFVMQGKLMASFVLVLLLGLTIGQNSARSQSFFDSFNPFKGIQDSLREIEAQVETIGNFAKAFGKLRLADEIGPADEFFIGREAAARLIGKKKLLPTESAPVTYLYQVGSTLALGSYAPYLYRPYTFMVIRDDDINAYATPGGLVLVTEGMLRFLADEDELAFILGHELAHVELDHGFQSGVEQGVGFFTDIMTAGSRAREKVGLAEIPGGDKLDESFNMLAGAISNGYSADVEGEADWRGIGIMWRVGYDTHAAFDVIRRFQSKTGSYGGAGYPTERLAEIQEKMKVEKYTRRDRPDIREQRFRKIVSRLTNRLSSLPPGDAYITVDSRILSNLLDRRPIIVSSHLR